MTIKVENPEQWKDVVLEILPKLKYPLLLLKGNLGAGKTTFTQNLLWEMDVKEQVSSPTYSIVNEYEVDGKKIYHFDLYRLNSPEEVDDIGIEEYLKPKNFCIIEWPEIYEEELQHYQHHLIEISHDDVGRTFNFQ